MNVKENSYSIYNTSTIYNQIPSNLKACLRKLNYQQQTRISIIEQNKGIPKINPK